MMLVGSHVISALFPSTGEVVNSKQRKQLNPLIAPEPLPILNPSNFVPEDGFPVVKGLMLSSAAYIRWHGAKDIWPPSIREAAVFLYS